MYEYARMITKVIYTITTRCPDGNPLLTPLLTPSGEFSSYKKAVDTFKELIARHPDCEITLQTVYYAGDFCIGMPIEAEYKNGKERWERDEENKTLEENKCIDRGWDDIPE